MVMDVVAALVEVKSALPLNCAAPVELGTSESGLASPLCAFACNVAPAGAAVTPSEALGETIVMFSADSVRCEEGGVPVLAALAANRALVEIGLGA
jgi:hypothetical protein